MPSHRRRAAEPRSSEGCGPVGCSHLNGGRPRGRSSHWRKAQRSSEDVDAIPRTMQPRGGKDATGPFGARNDARTLTANLLAVGRHQRATLLAKGVRLAELRFPITHHPAFSARDTRVQVRNTWVAVPRAPWAGPISAVCGPLLEAATADGVEPTKARKCLEHGLRPNRLTIPSVEVPGQDAHVIARLFPDRLAFAAFLCYNPQHRLTAGV